VLNTVNEIAVEKFLKGQISFLDISKISLNMVNKFHDIKIKNIDDIFEIDKEIRGTF
jgi:1-deoxy-D-xylulose-5-phosphate reductoisomerase